MNRSPYPRAQPPVRPSTDWSEVPVLAIRCLVSLMATVGGFVGFSQFGIVAQPLGIISLAVGLSQALFLTPIRHGRQGLGFLIDVVSVGCCIAVYGACSLVLALLVPWFAIHARFARPRN